MLQVQMEADGTVSEVKVAHTGDPEVYSNKPTVYIWERYKLMYMYCCLIQDLISVVHVCNLRKIQRLEDRSSEPNNESYLQKTRFPCPLTERQKEVAVDQIRSQVAGYMQ